MSPSEPVDRPPPEVMAIAVALAVLWPGARLEELTPAPSAEAPAWRWGRPDTYRWS